MIRRITDKKECCGCASCYNACTFGAIQMIEDVHGFQYPQIDLKKCTECQKCVQVCPINKKSQHSINLNSYVGHKKNVEQIKKCASGGAATALAEAMIENKGIVCGCAYGENFYSCEHIVVNSSDELVQLQGTKYIQSDKKHIYREIQFLLKTGKKILFIGLPCEAAGLKTFLGSEEPNLYICDLICHGPTSYQTQQSFIKYYERKYKSKIKQFAVRYKQKGWVPPYLHMKFENGKQYNCPLYATPMGDAINMLLRTSCYHCKFRGKNRYSDITLGDFWGCDENQNIYNHWGVSALICHTKKGKMLVDNIKDFEIKEESYEVILKNNPMLEKSFEKMEKADLFSEILVKKDIIYASKKVLGLKENVKRLLRYYR